MAAPEIKNKTKQKHTNQICLVLKSDFSLLSFCILDLMSVWEFSHCCGCNSGLVYTTTYTTSALGPDLGAWNRLLSCDYISGWPSVSPFAFHLPPWVDFPGESLASSWLLPPSLQPAIHRSETLAHLSVFSECMVSFHAFSVALSPSSNLVVQSFFERFPLPWSEGSSFPNLNPIITKDMV